MPAALSPRVIFSGGSRGAAERLPAPPGDTENGGVGTTGAMPQARLKDLDWTMRARDRAPRARGWDKRGACARSSAPAVLSPDEGAGPAVEGEQAEDWVPRPGEQGEPG